MNEDLSTFPHDRRAQDDRRDGAREGSERRRLLHGVRLKFSGAMANIEDWLDVHCDGECSLVIVEISDDLTRKTVEVMFENSEDREKFKASAGEF